MRQWLSKEHFVPFVVELDDGRPILISEPSVAFGGGSTGFIDPIDGALVDFTYDHVAGFMPQDRRSARERRPVCSRFPARSLGVGSFASSGSTL